MEKQQNAEAHRNILDSFLAKALLEDNKLPNRIFDNEVHKIDSISKKQQSFHDNGIRLFRSRGMIYNFEPIIVVERPPSPILMKKVLRSHETDDSTPHYMTELEKNKPAAYIPKPSVDAFKVKRNRKKNLWESVSNLKEDRFCSILPNSAPLTPEEKVDLNTGWNVYKPVCRVEESIQEKLKAKVTRQKTLATTVVKTQTYPHIFITETPNSSEKTTQQGLRITKTPYSQRSTPSLLRARQALQSEKERLEKFAKLREKHRTEYHKFIREQL